MKIHIKRALKELDESLEKADVWVITEGESGMMDTVKKLVGFVRLIAEETSPIIDEE